MIEIKIIDAQHKSDINIPNEPFQMFEKLYFIVEKSGHMNYTDIHRRV
mgnify:CR=1 FL=1